MSDEIFDFGQAILKRWKPGRNWDVQRIEAWSDDIVDQLRSVNLKGEDITDVLKHALTSMIATRDWPSTPSIAEVVQAVRHSVDVLAMRTASEKLDLRGGGAFGAGTEASRVPLSDRAWTGDGIKLAYDLIRTEMGRRAAAEGWVRPLWCHIAAYKRAPADSEIPALKREAAEFKESYEKAAKIPGPLGKAVYELGRRMVSDQQRLADIANMKNTPPRGEYYEKIFLAGLGEAVAGAKASPPSKYADENLEEGRGWVGRTA